MVYMASVMNEFFVSKKACRSLGIIEEKIPLVRFHQ